MKPYIATPRKNAPASCGRCFAEWHGTTVAHCAGCCRTFTGPSAFDEHRRAGQCHEPASLGLVFNERGRWGYEPMTDEQKRHRFGPGRGRRS